MAVFEPVIEDNEEYVYGNTGHGEQYFIADSDIYSVPDIHEAEIVEEPENIAEEQYYEPEVLGAGSPLSDTVDSSTSYNEVVQNIEHTHYYVSENTVYQVGEVVLDQEQFETIVETINGSAVSANYVTSEQFSEFSTAVISLNIIIVGVLFGYFVKESIFRSL